MDALTLAGGPTIHANMYKLILVRQSSNEMLVQSINVDRILTQGDASQMVYMASGDILFVPTVNMENVARFFDRVRRIFRAIVDVERSIILGDEVYDILRGEDRESTRRIIIEGDDDLFPP
jgi:protein involved in polysaccharide export with SLBB domain